MNFSKKDIYITSSVNSIGKCISWKQMLLCGMSKSIVLIDQSVDSSRIINQLTEHNDIVTCVSWLNNNNIVSGDNSGVLIIWNVDNCGKLINHKVHKVKNFKSGIMDISSVIIDSEIYIACCSEERWSLLKVSNVFDFLEIQSITYGTHYVHSIKAIQFYSSLLISCGLSDGRVMMQCYSSEINTLSPAVCLSGHEDTVVSIDSINKNSNVLVATASLDCYVRIWEVSTSSQYNIKKEMDTQIIIIGDIRINVRLAAILTGHENWVTSINFCKNEDSISLVSTSMDKSVIVWSETSSEDINEYSEWSEETRLGQIGGNGLGFIGGSISASGSMIVGVGYQGSMIVWARNSESSMWSSVINVGGHFDVVEDLSWESERGRYLLTVSKDQTTRIHAPWRGHGEWHEVGRPQIHGFDMTCVASLGPVTFVSGAEEKISRVFAMNKSYGDFFASVTGERFDGEELLASVVTTEALGLSNKTVADGEGDEPASLEGESVPSEERVVGRTLWPERTKLYGHVYEVFRVAAHRERAIVATSCKAAVAEYADVILWSSATWTIVQRLAFHKSTVVRVRFSRDGARLVSVSKDRQWALWRSAAIGDQYSLAAHSPRTGGHSKIIWDADWSADDSMFATVSRDKRMILWDGHDGSAIGAPLVLTDSINAIATMPLVRDNRHTFAVGLETGRISMVVFDRATTHWTVTLTFEAHHDWITRLAFRPSVDEDDRRCSFELASSARDRFVKVYEIAFE